MIDISIFDAGSIVVLSGSTAAGQEWLEAHLPDDTARWGRVGYVIERRYVQDILDGAMADGLLVGE